MATPSSFSMSFTGDEDGGVKGGRGSRRHTSEGFEPESFYVCGGVVVGGGVVVVLDEMDDVGYREHSGELRSLAVP